MVAEPNYAIFGDVGAETAAVDEWAEESGSGEVLEVGARFGQPAERSRVRDPLSLREGVTWSKAMARRDDELLRVRGALLCLALG